MIISVMNLLIYLSEGTNWYHQFSINSKTTIFCVLINTNVDKLFILNALIDLFLYGVHYFYYSDVLFFLFHYDIHVYYYCGVKRIAVFSQYQTGEKCFPFQGKCSNSFFVHVLFLLLFFVPLFFTSTDMYSGA